MQVSLLTLDMQMKCKEEWWQQDGRARGGVGGRGGGAGGGKKSDLEDAPLLSIY